MHVLHFNRAGAQQFLDAVKNGKPFTPPSGQWNGNDMLTLAGMLFAAVFSQGPHRHQAAGLTEEEVKKIAFERQEATNETLEKDIQDATGFISMLTFKVIDDEYDQSYEAEVSGIVYRDGNRKHFLPLKGVKKQ
jgi:hypothetical protein